MLRALTVGEAALCTHHQTHIAAYACRELQRGGPPPLDRRDLASHPVLLLPCALHLAVESLCYAAFHASASALQTVVTTALPSLPR